MDRKHPRAGRLTWEGDTLELVDLLAFAWTLAAAVGTTTPATVADRDITQLTSPTS